MVEQTENTGERRPLTYEEPPHRQQHADRSNCCHNWSSKYRVTLIVSLWGFLTCMERAIILPTLWLYLKTFWSPESAKNFYAATMAAFSLAVLGATPICGYLAERGTRIKLMLLICNQMELIGNIVYLFAPHPALVLIGRLIAGFGGGCEPPLFADLTRVTTRQERTKYILITLVARQFGLIFGPVFTLILERVNLDNAFVLVNVYNGPGLVMSILWVMHTVLSIMIYPSIDSQGREVAIPYRIGRTKSGRHRNFQQYIETVFTNKEKLETSPRHFQPEQSFCQGMRIFTSYQIIALLILSFNCYFCLMSLETVLSPMAEYMIHWTEREVSYVYLGCSLFILVVFAVLHIATSYFKDWTLAVFGTSLLSVTYIWIVINILAMPIPAKTVNLVLVIVGIAFHVIGLPFAVACGESLYTKLVPIDEMDRAQSVLRTVLNFAYLVGPLVGGGLWFVGYVVFGLMALSMIISCVMLSARRQAFNVPETPDEQEVNDDTRDSVSSICSDQDEELEKAIPANTTQP